MVTAKELLAKWFTAEDEAAMLRQLDEHYGKPHAQGDLDWADLVIALRMQVAHLEAEAARNAIATITAQADRINQLEVELVAAKAEAERVARRARRERRELLDRERSLALGGPQPQSDLSEGVATLPESDSLETAEVPRDRDEPMDVVERMRETRRHPLRFAAVPGEANHAERSQAGIARVANHPVTRELSERTHQLTDSRELYLDLLKNCLTRLLFGEHLLPIDPNTHEGVQFDPQRRVHGDDWPSEAETMVGLRRLDNVQQCVVDVLHRQVPGDLVETGVWRGGVTILMRAVLKAYGDPVRLVWAADSFEGLPVPDAEKYSADRGADFSKSAGFEVLAASLEEVQANFARYGLLDDRVRFLKGWFRDTLPTAPIEQIAVLRLDGDLYESTIDALEALYPKVSVGGYVIIDDYQTWPQCRAAVEDYRAEHNLDEPIQHIDEHGSFWQRER